jgi:hypothetical protein
VQGRVISLVRPGRHDDFAHPNVVVIQLAPDTHLCVAGFSPGKEKYESAKKAEHSQGIWGPAFAVEIDHARHLTPVKPNLELHLCGYVCHTAEIMTLKQLQAGSCWGLLSNAAIREVAEGLLSGEATRSFLPKRAVAALKAIVQK